MRPVGTVLFVALALLGCRAGEEVPDANEPELLRGGPAEMGEGAAWTYAELDADGNPSVIGVAFTEGFLRGLPEERNPERPCFDLSGDGVASEDEGECLGDYTVEFDLPPELMERADVPFEWVSVSWEPVGHGPLGVYDLSHFDFHFFMQSRDEVHAIRPGPCGVVIDCEDFERAIVPVPSRYQPEDYVDVQAAVADMGNHLIDPSFPELGDPPQKFTKSLIYGAYEGHITFIEPMMTLEYLESRPDECGPIKQPQSWETTGYYPTMYCIRYSEDEGMYEISLEGLAYHQSQ